MGGDPIVTMAIACGAERPLLAPGKQAAEQSQGVTWPDPGGSMHFCAGVLPRIQACSSWCCGVVRGTQLPAGLAVLMGSPTPSPGHGRTAA